MSLTRAGTLHHSHPVSKALAKWTPELCHSSQWCQAGTNHGCWHWLHFHLGREGQEGESWRTSRDRPSGDKHPYPFPSIPAQSHPRCPSQGCRRRSGSRLMMETRGNRLALRGRLGSPKLISQISPSNQPPGCKGAGDAEHPWSGDSGPAAPGSA